MFENGAPETIVEVRSGFGGEDVALLRVEAHPPVGCPFLEVLEVGLQGEVILKGADLPIEQAVIREESYCGLHGVRQIIGVAQEKKWARHYILLMY